jgi:hypothetical protein
MHKAIMEGGEKDRSSADAPESAVPFVVAQLPPLASSLINVAAVPSNSVTRKKRSSSSKKKPAAKPKNQRKLRAKAAAAYTTPSKKWNYCWTVSLNTCQ